MTPEEKTIFGIEQRWLSKIAEAVQQGTLEKVRQSGLYLDTDAQLAIASTPTSVARIDAERWIWARYSRAQFAEKGVYYQAYSPLAELVTAANAGDEEAARMLKAAELTVKEAAATAKPA